MSQEHIAWLSHISRADESIVGAKAADLGELTRLNLPVPNGFVVGTTAYYSFLQQTGLRTKLELLFERLDVSDSKKLQAIAKQAQSMVMKVTVPEEIRRDIVDAYHHLSAKDAYVAVRASMPETDGDWSAAAQSAQLNIIGAKDVVATVQQTWSGLFAAALLYDRAERGQSQLSSGTAVIVQRMIESETSGILFTRDPMANNADIMSIEAAWGLGEPIVSGEITPDHYEVHKQTWQIERRDLVRQEWQLVRGADKKSNSQNVRLPVSAAWQHKQKLSDQQIVILAKLAVKVEEHFGCPQDCEWAFADHTFYIVQTRPVPVLDPVSPNPIAVSVDSASVVLLDGVAAAPGAACGPVRLVRSVQDIARVRNGEIVVTDDTNPAYDQIFDKAGGIITTGGSIGSHAAAMSRQRGLPAVVTVGDIAGLLHAGEEITIDGDHGKVYAGHAHITPDSQLVGSEAAHATQAHPEKGILAKSDQQMATATKIMVTVTEPESAERLAEAPSDGVGLLRAEFMLSRLGEHPLFLAQQGRQDVVTSTLYDGMMAVAKAFSPRPVIYRASDFTGREYARLHGGEQFEVAEQNPLVGFRGAYRYDSEPAIFKQELTALRKARTYYKNIWLAVPFVRRPEELLAVKQLLADEGLYRSSTFKVHMIAEVPANVFLLDQFIGVGIDGIIVGTNVLTQLILGVDRDNPRTATLFDQQHPAVLAAMEQLVKGAARHGISSMVYGQMPALYPELTNQLVAWGVSSLAVSPESLITTRRMVAEAELLAATGKGPGKK